MILDTNIVIACLREQPTAVKAITNWRQSGHALFISVVTMAETLSLPTLTAKEINTIKDFLKTFIPIPANEQTAELAGELQRTYQIGLADALIAASASLYRVALVTRDRQFRKVKEIQTVEV